MTRREAQCFDIRKLTPRETGRLMGVREERLDQMERSGLKPSALYKLFGNSIVVDVLAAIYRELWYHDPTEHPVQQLSLFPEPEWHLERPDRVRLVSLCSGYDSQAMALEVLARWAEQTGREPLPWELVAWAEYDPESKAPLDRQPAVVAHKALFADTADRNLGDMTRIDWPEVIRKYGIKVYNGNDGKDESNACDNVAGTTESDGGRSDVDTDKRLSAGNGCDDNNEVRSDGHDEHNDVGALSDDINSDTVRRANQILTNGEIDLLTYSTPCTDISQAGKRAGIAKDSGTRSAVLWYTEEAIRHLRPRILLQENVAALVNQQNSADFKEWRHTVERLGYRSYWAVLNARDYGILEALGPVPQNRERLFMVSVRQDLCPGAPYPFPNPMPLTRTIADVLDEDVSENFFLKPESVVSFLTRNENGDECLYRVSDHLPTAEEIMEWVREESTNHTDGNA